MNVNTDRWENRGRQNLVKIPFILKSGTFSAGYIKLKDLRGISHVGKVYGCISVF